MDDSIDDVESVEESSVSGETVKVGSELPVPIDTLLLDGIRPEMGDRVTVEVEGTISKIRDDCAYVKLENANDQPIKSPATHPEDEMTESGLLGMSAALDKAPY
jgi:hypothetical protein